MAIAMKAPVLPAETTACASPSSTAATAFQRLEPLPWRNAWLALISMPMAFSAGTTSLTALWRADSGPAARQAGRRRRGSGSAHPAAARGDVDAFDHDVGGVRRRPSRRWKERDRRSCGVIVLSVPIAWPQSADHSPARRGKPNRFQGESGPATLWVCQPLSGDWARRADSAATYCAMPARSAREARLTPSTIAAPAPLPAPRAPAVDAPAYASRRP